MNSMVTEFELSPEQLTATARAFFRKVMDGLAGKDTEIRCLPVYLHPRLRKTRGKAYVLDLGGSNMRAAVVSITANGPELATPVKQVEIPWQRGKAFPLDQYLSLQAKILSQVVQPETCPLGYCFSYPARSLPGGDAELISWTKGISVPGTRSQRIGQMLLDHIEARQSEIKISRAVVVNDTVASLFAGLTGPVTDAYAGMVVGTGTNMATFFPSKEISKNLPVQMPGTAVPVNLESGNFTPPFLTTWDEQVDGASENPGQQRFEKAVSGIYMGRIFKAVFPESRFPENAGTAVLLDFIDRQGGPQRYREVINAILRRSSMLVAAQLAGLALVHQQFIPGFRKIKIVAEGGVFWGRGPDALVYADSVRKWLATVMGKLPCSSVEIGFERVAQANLVGGAIAALADR